MTAPEAPPNWLAIDQCNDATVAEAARTYTAFGLHPFAVHGVCDGRCTCGKGAACPKPGKHPVAKGWQNAPLEIEELVKSFEQHPDRNIGLRMGEQSGGFALVAIDVDGGLELLAPISKEARTIFPMTLEAKTSRGIHRLYRWPDGKDLPKNGVSVVPGVDVRSGGGQIVAPPSVHASGMRYQWSSCREPATLPAAIADAILRLQKRSKSEGGPATEKRAVERHVATPVRAADGTDRGSRVLNAALAGEVKKVRSTVEGTRNVTLNNAALKLAHPRQMPDGQVVELTDAQIISALKPAALEAGLEEREADATIASGITAGRKTMLPVPEPTRSAGRDASQGGAPLPDDDYEHTDADAPNAPPNDAILFQRGDHAEMADRLVMTLRSVAPVVFSEGQFWRYSARRHVFECVEQAELSQVVQRFAGTPTRVGSSGNFKPLRVGANDVAGGIRLASDQISDPRFFVDAPKGLVFENGFIEVTPEKTTLQEHSPNHRARFCYPFSFDVTATPTRLLQFFAEVFRDDADVQQKIALLQEYVGTAMIGLATRYHKALMLLGAGRNGKEVFAKVAQAAMPPGSCVSIPPQDFGQEYRRAMLAGKLLNIVAELPEAEILDSESFKALVAGDSTTGREIRQSPFTFSPVAGHIHSANRLPGTPDQTHGFWSRFELLEFNRIFAPHEQNPTLADEIIGAELTAVVAWFLAGAQRVQVLRRYTVPPSSAAAIDEWRKNADQVRAFIDEYCERVDPHGEPWNWGAADVLYRAYPGWASNNGHRPLASNKFAERMGMLGLGRKHLRTGNVYPVSLKESDAWGGQQARGLA